MIGRHGLIVLGTAKLRFPPLSPIAVKLLRLRNPALYSVQLGTFIDFYAMWWRRS